MKNYIKAFLARRAEKKRLKIRAKEVEKICRTIRSFGHGNLHRVTRTRKIIGLTEFLWDFELNGRKFRIGLDEMIRGDLFRLVEIKGHDQRTLVEFGDQSRAYGFFGLCKDLYCVDDFTLEDIKKIIGENNNVRDHARKT